MSARLKLLYAGAQLYWWLFKPVTFGVKAMLIHDDTVLLVKHSYEKGWHLPGGGVKRGESAATAVRREAREELGAAMTAVSFFGLFSNINENKSDHIVVFVCTDFTLSGKQDAEIEAYGFFAFDQLPPETTAGSARRVAEYCAGQKLPYLGEW